jgi:transcriptional regulator with XRE-family HTH domain
VLTDGRTYTDIAKETKVSNSTINNLATGKTRWPRPTTLFPLLMALKMHIELVDD